jgi:hypothetical protein
LQSGQCSRAKPYRFGPGGFEEAKTQHTNTIRFPTRNGQAANPYRFEANLSGLQSGQCGKAKPYRFGPGGFEEAKTQHTNTIRFPTRNGQAANPYRFEANLSGLQSHTQTL